MVRNQPIIGPVQLVQEPASETEMYAMRMPIISLAIAAALAASPAYALSASDEKQCADQFKAADLDNSGELSSSEIGNARQQLPASMAMKDRVTRGEFMAVCGKKAS
jgi:hypothetical protein